MTGISRRLLWGGVGLLFLLRLIVAVQMPLVPDEAYYWLWSRHLQWGYLDHPFMIALWIRAGTFLWGDTPFGVRFCGLMGFGLAMFWLCQASGRFFPHRRDVGLRAVLLLNVTVMAGIGLVPATPDVPLFMFLCLSLWGFSRALSVQGQAKASWGWWMLCGVSLGLAADSKYTAVLFGAGLAGFVLFGGRALWRSAGPWLGGSCALVAVLPTLIWNADHGWAGLLKQGGRASQWHPERAGQFLGELLAGQLALLTPWVAVLCCVGLWRSRREGSLLLWLVGPALLVFLLHVTGDRVQPNWVWVLYPVLVLAGAAYAGTVRGAVLTGTLCVLLVYGQCLTGFLPLSAHLNPIARLSAGWEGMAEALSAESQEKGISVMVTDDYALASILTFQKAEHVVFMGQDSRWAYLKGLTRKTVQTALYLKDLHYGPVPAGAWALWRKDGGQPVRLYSLEMRHDLSGWIVQ
ncbi:glycosyltransferase family 39 protein [Bombella sp. TMW 2.2559]|uniref:Glycosyltransferase family 39 protein n=1 Tax=Bombella dulcis TaxID=2967339 RepID=A0ABT3WA35_9PROT|nr:glycosyltransferase family 39 protein [Bombella dulcis]MCX5615936.1 glycosyltransferase family 39 protein [Bombella dulcis]